MPYNSLLALPVLGASVLSLLASASPHACSSPAPPAARAASPPQAPGVPSPPAVPEARPRSAAPEPPEACRHRVHTLTIYNGTHVTQQTFVRRNAPWRICGDDNHRDACYRDGPCRPQRCRLRNGPCRSPRGAENPACCLRATGNRTSTRRPCH